MCGILSGTGVISRHKFVSAHLTTNTLAGGKGKGSKVYRNGASRFNATGGKLLLVISMFCVGDRNLYFSIHVEYHEKGVLAQRQWILRTVPQPFIVSCFTLLKACLVHISCDGW